MPCRINKRKLWTSRLLLESTLHSDACFVTLTYKDMPEGGNLAPRDVVLWLKRLRFAVRPVKLRYYLVGEYGERLSRPHYHALLFGISPSEYFEGVIRKSWGLGHVQLGDLNVATIRYCVGYTIKRMTRAGDARLEGHVPEFARMSRSPGIGVGFALAVARSLAETPCVVSALKSGDGVPVTVNVGGRVAVFGRHLREKISEATGIPRETEAAKIRRLEELLDLQAANPFASVEEVVRETQRALNVETRERIFSSRRKL